jgi:ribosome-binding factor A
MPTTRQNKVARLLQKELAEIFQREARGMFGGAFITITQVQVSPDLSVAKIYLSVMAVKDKQAFLEELKKHVSEIRKHLGLRVKHQLRIVPELVFYIDDSLDYADRIDKLLRQ